MTRIGILNCIADAIFCAIMLIIWPFTDQTFQLRLWVTYMLMQFICGRYKRVVLLATDELKLNIISHIWAYVFGVLIIWSYAPFDIYVLLGYIAVCFIFSMFFAIFSRHRLRKIYKHRVLVVGIGESAERFRQTVSKNRFSMFDIRGFIDCNDSYNFENIHPIRTKKIPILGEIACGQPIYCDREYDSYIETDSDIQADFALIAKGDSMINARIQNGDIVFVRSQPMVENGEIAAVCIDDEATLKRVYISEETVTLVAENPAYQPIVYNLKNSPNIRILGKAIAFQSRL